MTPLTEEEQKAVDEFQTKKAQARLEAGLPPIDPAMMATQAPSPPMPDLHLEIIVGQKRAAVTLGKVLPEKQLNQIVDKVIKATADWRENEGGGEGDADE